MNPEPPSAGAAAPGGPDPRFAEAVRQFEAGRGQEAYAICQRILAANPHDLSALHLTSVMYLQQGRHDIAIDMLSRALAANEHPALLDAMGEALRGLGRFDEAAHHYQRAIDLAPDVPMLHANLGNVWLQRGLFEQAIGAYERALALGPDNFVTHNNLGIALSELGRLDEAVASYRRALAVNPSYVEAHNNLGNAFRAKHDLAAAIDCYRQAIGFRPDYAAGYSNLGIALLDQGRLDEAVAAIKTAIAINPGYVEAHNNLGGALRAQGKLEQAVASYSQALTLNPDHADVHNNLGVALRDLGQLDAAKAAYQRALALNPNSADTLANFGGLLREQGLLGEAIATQRAALAQQPGMPLAEAELIYAQSLACDWSERETWAARLRVVAERPHMLSPFILLTHGAGLADQLFCAKQWIAEPPHRAATTAHQPRPEQGKIRLGYLSVDFRDDVVGVLLPELIERHDKSEFAVAAYCYGGEDAGETRRRLRAGFDRFTELGALGTDEAAQRIRADGIDILIDLMGYTMQARWPVVAQRPAPVQVSYLGYPATMGAGFIDYIVVDPSIAPAADQRFYAERLVHLPECYQPSDTRRQIAPRPTRRECGLPEQGFVFCCFNNSYKMAPAFFDIWMRLLRDVPDSVLWLVGSHPLVERNLGREAAARGVDPARLVFAERAPMVEYLGRLQAADLFLDTLPYNAGATANDALWAGLPVLTCTGDSYTGRMAGSLLRAVGLPELVTQSPAEYAALALRLATEPRNLAALRDRLRRDRDTCPLFDMARYTRHLEAAYKRMWENWRRGAAPTSFAVDALPRQRAGLIARFFGR